MSDRCYVSTRRTVHGSRGFQCPSAAFVGDNVTLTMYDPRNGHLLAALNQAIRCQSAAFDGRWAPKRGRKFLLRNIRRCRKLHTKALPFFNKLPTGRSNSFGEWRREVWISPA
jgi:hypothetical protein